MAASSRAVTSHTRCRSALSLRSSSVTLHGTRYLTSPHLPSSVSTHLMVKLPSLLAMV